MSSEREVISIESMNNGIEVELLYAASHKT